MSTLKFIACQLKISVHFPHHLPAIAFISDTFPTLQLVSTLFALEHIQTLPNVQLAARISFSIVISENSSAASISCTLTASQTLRYYQSDVATPTLQPLEKKTNFVV